jgi:hypothetical protein
LRVAHVVTLSLLRDGILKAGRTIQREKTLLFLKKKKQKDFYFLAAAAVGLPAQQASWDERRNKSLFASFSSEKEDSFLLNRRYAPDQDRRTA